MLLAPRTAAANRTQPFWVAIPHYNFGPCFACLHIPQWKKHCSQNTLVHKQPLCHCNNENGFCIVRTERVIECACTKPCNLDLVHYYDVQKTMATSGFCSFSCECLLRHSSVCVVTKHFPGQFTSEIHITSRLGVCFLLHENTLVSKKHSGQSLFTIWVRLKASGLYFLFVGYIATKSFFFNRRELHNRDLVSINYQKQSNLNVRTIYKVINSDL